MQSKHATLAYTQHLPLCDFALIFALDNIGSKMLSNELEHNQS